MGNDRSETDWERNEVEILGKWRSRGPFGRPCYSLILGDSSGGIIRLPVEEDVFNKIPLGDRGGLYVDRNSAPNPPSDSYVLLSGGRLLNPVGGIRQ